MRRVAAFFLSCLLLSSARAQVEVDSGDFVSVAGSSAGGRLLLISSAGQPASTAPMQGGSFRLEGGFLSNVPTIPALSISHTRPDVVPLGQALTLEADIEASVQQAEIHYRTGGDASYDVLAMTGSAGRYQATIAAEAVTNRGLSYYIAVIDSLGRTVYSPFVGAHAVRVQVPEPGIVRGAPQPAGSTQSAYRIVSIPMLPQNVSPAAVLSDDFGPYDPDVWRFFELSFDQDYVEFGNVDAIEPGKGYWLITSEADRVIDTGAGTTTPLSPYQIRLHPRWNLIGAPFNFSVPVQQLSLRSGQPLALRALRDGWNDPVRDPVTTLEPFEGYAIFNALQTVDTLVVVPFSDGAPKSSPRVAASKTDEADGWSIHVAAITQHGRDADNVVGVHPAALDEWDPMDFPEPPMIGRHVSLSFKRAHWDAPSRRFSTDFRAPSASGHDWEFEVSTPGFEMVTLTFDGIPSIPSHLDVWLVDETARVSQDLRKNARYQIAAAAETPYVLRISVGDYEEGGSPDDGSELPSDAVLAEVYPNPFTSAAAVRFSLPEERPVTVRVYDALGAEVATLLDGATRAAGNHLTVWDGRAASGVHAGSGVYFVNVLAGHERVTRKVVLVR